MDFFVHTYLQLIIVRVPRNYEDNIPVDYESELRVSNLSFYILAYIRRVHCTG
jgi:hypothetical protein